MWYIPKLLHYSLYFVWDDQGQSSTESVIKCQVCYIKNIVLWLTNTVWLHYLVCSEQVHQISFPCSYVHMNSYHFIHGFTKLQ